MVNLPLFLLVTIVLIFIVHQIYHIWGFKGIEYERFFDRTECVEGEEVYLIEEVHNNKWLPMLWIRFESTMHANLKFYSQLDMNISSGDLYQNHRSVFSFMPFTRINRKHQVLCSRRGCYRLDSAYITYGDPFGYIIVRKSKESEIRDG